MSSAPAGETGLERLRLLGSALAGRAVDVAAAAPGDAAWTDGATIFLDVTAVPSDRLLTLCVQASLLAAGSLEPGVAHRLAHRPALARRYLAVEGHRALAANESVLPRRARSVVDLSVASSVDSPDSSLARARARRAGSDPPPVFGAIDARRILAAAERAAPPGTTSPSVVRTGPGHSLAELEDDEDDERNLGHAVSSPVGGGGPLGRLLQRLLEPTRARGGGGPPGADAPTHVTWSRPGASRRAAPVLVPARATDDGPLPAPEPAPATYPEWDVHRQRYRSDWCTVIERPAPAAGVAATSRGVFALQRSLARLGLGLLRCRRQLDGDDVDIDAAVEARVEMLAGSPPGDAVYLDSRHRRRDVGVLVLLDVSGSAGEPGMFGKTIHAHQQAVAGALTVALHDLGDRVALFAFNSRGRRAVQLLRVKSFDEQYSGHVASRLAGLESTAYTRLGAAIRHGSAILEARAGTPRRLLVVLSDGIAYDHGYEGRYGEADARRALTEARRRGVGCLCLSIGADVDAASLRRVFGAAAHATVPRPDELAEVIGPLFRSALASAEARRRAFARSERTRERLELERRMA